MNTNIVFLTPGVAGMLLSTEEARAELYSRWICGFFADRFRVLLVELRGREFLQSRVSEDVDPLSDHKRFFSRTINDYDCAVSFGKATYPSNNASAIAGAVHDRLERLISLFLGRASDTRRGFVALREELARETESVIEGCLKPFAGPVRYPYGTFNEPNNGERIHMNITENAYTGEEDLNLLAKESNPVLDQVPLAPELLLVEIGCLVRYDLDLCEHLEQLIRTARAYERPKHADDAAAEATLKCCKLGRDAYFYYLRYQQSFWSSHGWLHQPILAITREALLYVLKRLEWIARRDDGPNAPDQYFKCYYSTLRRHQDVRLKRIMVEGKWVRVARTGGTPAEEALLPPFKPASPEEQRRSMDKLRAAQDAVNPKDRVDFSEIICQALADENRKLEGHIHGAGPGRH